ncbi:hypothetical protein [Jidongwangia harbinensis]|uniref:hypothetical protein n=1 Tax=Jidongwangia harbinensis TaxID=2878561 RepID=UPI001CD9512E|nr:hypothetical protein [Jidongwangia harbinensis]MCA2216281.1 hypothetical protein [Jidongwangia harbinensis]MCA2217016.1 hypothetical protein [Jidongwangia harbinensis]
MEELVALIVIPVVGFVARSAAKKGIAVLKAKDVKIPSWLAEHAPSLVGGVASVGAGGAIHSGPLGDNQP